MSIHTSKRQQRFMSATIAAASPFIEGQVDIFRVPTPDWFVAHTIEALRQDVDRKLGRLGIYEYYAQRDEDTFVVQALTANISPAEQHPEPTTAY